jgi:hypothetical protein
MNETPENLTFAQIESLQKDHPKEFERLARTLNTDDDDAQRKRHPLSKKVAGKIISALRRKDPEYFEKQKSPSSESNKMVTDWQGNKLSNSFPHSSAIFFCQTHLSAFLKCRVNLVRFFSLVSWPAILPREPERIDPYRKSRTSRLEFPTRLPHAKVQANDMALSKPAVQPPLRPAGAIPSSPTVRE